MNNCAWRGQSKKNDKPWGYEIIWAESGKDTGYIGKLLHINSGHRLSKQYHEIKEETVYVLEGTLLNWIDEENPPQKYPPLKKNNKLIGFSRPVARLQRFVSCSL